MPPVTMLLVFFVLCDISIFVTSHSVHHTRSGHHYPSPYFRHSHYHSQHLLHQRPGKRVRTGLDQLMEKLNVTDELHADGDNNLDSLLNLDNTNDNLNDSVTTERWKPSTTSWQKEVYNKPDEYNEEDDEDNTEDEEEEDIGIEEPKDSTVHVNTQADSENGYRSRLTDYKWKTMGSKVNLDRTFQSFKSGGHYRLTPEESFARNEAERHSTQMMKETVCKVPRPKLIKVADFYPANEKYYSPKCTILHQCSEDSGCCKGEHQKCLPKKSEAVILYFNVVSFVFRGQSKHSTTSVEKLKFFNHTECECDKRDDDMPRDSALRPLDLQRLPEHSCSCPSEYSVRHLASGQCVCDCFDKQRDCIKYKKGKEYFNHRDRLCIETEKCLPPSCDFGMYNRRSGRCPRKHEKFRTWSRFSKN